MFLKENSMRIADISTSLRQRFEAVRDDQTIENIATAIGITTTTLCRWHAQYRITRITVLTKIEAWVEAQEAAQQQPVVRA